MGLVSYTNIEDGQSADANVFNSRYGDILAQVNGNLDSSNIRNGTLTRELFAQDALSAAWPVGSIYISINDVNPGSLFGGSWVRFGQGKALVGVDESDEDFEEAERTFGSKTHTLKVSEMPSHTHPPLTYTRMWSTNRGATPAKYQPNGTASGIWNPTLGSGDNIASDATTGSRGGGGAHNNVQPSVAVYLWKRVG